MSWNITRGTGPLVITAIHAGHALRPEVSAFSALDDATRLREEDPYTDRWAALSSNRVVVQTSRFEVDLNRPVHKSVYMQPSDAWGLNVWKEKPHADVIERSRRDWWQFYLEVGELLDEVHARHGHVVVLDIHSYCHRRRGPGEPFDNPWLNPEINIGTANNMDRTLWAPVVDGLIDDLKASKFGQRALDVRENVKFTGGHFSRWINERYGRDACAIAIEVKKTFMDEWTGALDGAALDLLVHAFDAALPRVLQQLEAMAATDDACVMPTSTSPACEPTRDYVES